MAKHDQKGRSKTDARHTRLPHLMTGSAAWLDLSGNAVKTLVALQRFDRGQDNGRLFLGAREAATATGLSRNTVMNALRELEEHGFIAAVERGHFQVKGGPATCWRLTFVSVPTSSSGATNEWQRWAPPPPSGNKSRAQNLTATGANSDIGRGNTEAAGSKITPMPTETSHVSVSTAGSNIAPQVVCHRQGGDQGVFPQRKQLICASGVSTDLVGVELLDALRERIGCYLKAAGVGAQTRLAASAKVPGGTLSKFLAGKNLHRTHFVALQLAVTNAARIAA